MTVVNHMRIAYERGEVNGRPLPRLDYERTEYSDGTFTERGLPPGCPSKPTLEQLWSAARRAPA